MQLGTATSGRLAPDLHFATRAGITAATVVVSADWNAAIRKALGPEQRLSHARGAARRPIVATASKADVGNRIETTVSLSGPWELITHPRHARYAVRARPGSALRTPRGLRTVVFPGPMNVPVINPPRMDDEARRAVLAAEVVIKRAMSDRYGRHRV